MTPELTPLHRAILKVLGEKPLEHTEASYVRARMLTKGFGLYDICKAMCSLEEWGQLVMCGLEDSDPEAKMTLLLTPNGRVTATGAALGITSVVLPVAQESGFGTTQHPSGLANASVPGVECESGVGKEDLERAEPTSPAQDIEICTAIPHDRKASLAVGSAGNGNGGVGERPHCQKDQPTGGETLPLHRPTTSIAHLETPAGIKFAPQMSGKGDGKTEAYSQVASWEPSPETLVDRVFTICERAERELVPEEEKLSDADTAREQYNGIRLVK